VLVFVCLRANPGSSFQTKKPPPKNNIPKPRAHTQTNTHANKKQTTKRHAYERSKPVFNATVDACGPVHVSVGDGGNVEGLYNKFVDASPPPYCADPKLFQVPVYQVRHLCVVCFAFV
jgi:hypothetical protein